LIVLLIVACVSGSICATLGIVSALVVDDATVRATLTALKAHRTKV